MLLTMFFTIFLSMLPLLDPEKDVLAVDWATELEAAKWPKMVYIIVYHIIISFHFINYLRY